MDSETENAFREFVEGRSLALLRTAYLLTGGDQHQAEDLVQSALTKLAGRWHKVDAPEAYVRRTIYNDQVSWWRRRRRVREHPVAESPDRAVDDATEQIHQRIDLRNALQELGPRQRAVVVLRFIEDLPEQEVAEILGCTVGTVRSQASRAIAKLRRIGPDRQGANQRGYDRHGPDPHRTVSSEVTT